MNWGDEVLDTTERWRQLIPGESLEARIVRLERVERQCFLDAAAFDKRAWKAEAAVERVERVRKAEGTLNHQQVMHLTAARQELARAQAGAAWKRDEIANLSEEIAYLVEEQLFMAEGGDLEAVANGKAKAHGLAAFPLSSSAYDEGSDDDSEFFSDDDDEDEEGEGEYEYDGDDDDDRDRDVGLPKGGSAARSHIQRLREEINRIAEEEDRLRAAEIALTEAAREAERAHASLGETTFLELGWKMKYPWPSRAAKPPPPTQIKILDIKQSRAQVQRTDTGAKRLVSIIELERFAKEQNLGPFAKMGRTLELDEEEREVFEKLDEMSDEEILARLSVDEDDEDVEEEEEEEEEEGEDKDEDDEDDWAGAGDVMLGSRNDIITGFTLQ